jgi:hypothetical protein
MRITHYITFDKGSGPVSLVEFQGDAGIQMIRVTHRAKFDRVKEVDPGAARAAVDGAANLGEATTKVPAAHAKTLTQEVLRWASQMGCTSQGLRWGADGCAILFRNEAEAVAWDQGNAETTVEPQPRRRKMIMG